MEELFKNAHISFSLSLCLSHFPHRAREISPHKNARARGLRLNNNNNKTHRRRKKEMEYVSLEGLRTDGRRPNEHRFCACTFRNPISQSNGCSGSAEFKLGQTCCVAAVFGPMASSAQNAVDPLAQEQLKVTVEITSAAFGTDVAALFTAPARKTALLAKKSSTSSSKSDRKNKELALKFEQILSQCVDAKRFPRSEVYVSAATINDDGSASAALFNRIFCGRWGVLQTVA